MVLVLSSRKWTLRPVVWVPLLIRLQNCGIYYHRNSKKLIPYLSSNHFYQNGTDRNAIVTVVIYAILTMFKWRHIDGSLFYIFPPLVMPYASNACTVILFYVLILWVLHWRLIAYFMDVISSLLTIAMFGFCETEFLCILCVCFLVFFISSIACIISSVTIIQSPNSLLANVTCL